MSHLLGNTDAGIITEVFLLDNATIVTALFLRPNTTCKIQPKDQPELLSSGMRVCVYIYMYVCVCVFVYMYVCMHLCPRKLRGHKTLTIWKYDKNGLCLLNVFNMSTIMKDKQMNTKCFLAEHTQVCMCVFARVRV